MSIYVAAVGYLKEVYPVEGTDKATRRGVRLNCRQSRSGGRQYATVMATFWGAEVNLPDGIELETVLKVSGPAYLGSGAMRVNVRGLKAWDGDKWHTLLEDKTEAADKKGSADD